MNQYEQNIGLLKALVDVNRLEIVDMLSCGELCGCKILEHFQITQPTLSHHMKTLCDCELVSGRKEGKWTYYSLNTSKAEQFKEFLAEIFAAKDNCVCTETESGCCE